MDATNCFIMLHQVVCSSFRVAATPMRCSHVKVRGNRQFTGKSISLREVVGKPPLRERLGNRITRACGPLFSHRSRRVSTGSTTRAGTRHVTSGGSSVVEDRQVHLAQAYRIGNRGHRGDLASPDLKIEDSAQPPMP